MRNLAALRKAKGWSQNELARMSGVSSDAIRNLEGSDGFATRATAEKLATALGCQVDDLYKRGGARA